MTPTDIWRQWSRHVRRGELSDAIRWARELRLCKAAPDWTVAQCSAFRVWWAVRGPGARAVFGAGE